MQSKIIYAVVLILIETHFSLQTIAFHNVTRSKMINITIRTVQQIWIPCFRSAKTANGVGFDLARLPAATVRQKIINCETRTPTSQPESLSRAPLGRVGENPGNEVVQTADRADCVDWVGLSLRFQVAGYLLLVTGEVASSHGAPLPPLPEDVFEVQLLPFSKRHYRPKKAIFIKSTAIISGFTMITSLLKKTTTFWDTKIISFYLT